MKILKILIIAIIASTSGILTVAAEVKPTLLLCERDVFWFPWLRRDETQVSINFSEKKVFKVATKFQNISENYFKQLNIQTETIKLNGSIELAVKYGVADFILDLVQSGKTLKDNQLYENVIINNDISTVIISSYFAYDTKKNFIKKLLNKGL